MKKLLITLLAAAGLAAGVQAEGTGTLYNAGNYALYKSSLAVISSTGQQVVSGSAILHKVIVSSTVFNVDVSTNGLFQIYDGQGSNAALRAEVDITTFSVTNGNREYTFDIAMSSGIWTDMSSSQGTGGAVTLIYSNMRPSSPGKYRVWTSSYSAADTAVHRLVAGPVLLHKIIVLEKGTGTSVLTAYDSYETASPTGTRRIAGIDLTDTAREYTYNVLCSSGITFESSGAGTVNPKVMVLYKRNPSQDYEVWRSSFTTGTLTNQAISTNNSAVFGGIINGDSVTASQVTVYDSQGAASRPLAVFDGTSSFDRRMYDIQASSGITITSTGNGLYSILYKDRQ